MERETVISVEGKEKPVVIIDNGENFKNGEGRIPNHDKILIVYDADKQNVPNT